MIRAYTGKTGSGKTYSMVRDAYREWRRGRDVYSNTLLFFDKMVSSKRRQKCGRIIYFENINEIIEVKNALILFDEAQVLFNARLWEALPEEFQFKLQQHRKHHLDLFCTTQNMGTIDITYRRLVHEWFHHEDKFALLWKRNPSWLTLHARQKKDVDYLYNTVDDLTVPTQKTRYFLIHRFKKRLYDTYFDIGFKRFTTIWLVNSKETQTGNLSGTRTWAIVPKKMSLSDASRAIRLYSSPLGPNNWNRSKKT